MYAKTYQCCQFKTIRKVFGKLNDIMHNMFEFSLEAASFSFLKDPPPYTKKKRV